MKKKCESDLGEDDIRSARQKVTYEILQTTFKQFIIEKFVASFSINGKTVGVYEMVITHCILGIFEKSSIYTSYTWSTKPDVRGLEIILWL